MGAADLYVIAITSAAFRIGIRWFDVKLHGSERAGRVDPDDAVLAAAVVVHAVGGAAVIINLTEL